MMRFKKKKAGEPRQRKIAIVGTSPSSCMDAPYSDETWEIWALGRNYQLNQRYTLWFELHDFWLLKELQMIKEQFDFIKSCGDKLIINAPHPEYPKAQIYPKDEILAKYPRRYFTSSIAWMMALAMEQNPAEIGLWGIDLCVNEEYNYQKGCVEYLVGIAEGRGIKVTIPHVSSICRASYLYGFEEPKWLSDINLRIKETEATLAENERKAKDHELAVSYLKGVKDCLKDQEKRWM